MRNPLGRYRDAIFFASGFAGLIYESIWTHYLKLFLGHAAYAQTLVLAIFMGGMAVGAGLAARYAANARNPLLIYAGIEATIGLLALVFHPLFVAVTGGFYDVTFAHHVDGAPFAAAKWGLASLLILPQSILLGATFPVFTSAATRAAPASEGRSIATLYFANSLGGAVGVVASGFVLIPAIGLPGTIGTAGAINFAIAALVWLMSKAAPAPAPAIEAPPVVKARPAARGAAAAQKSAKPVAIEPRFGSTVTLLLAVSFLTGASSFIYEIGWIRMLSLVLGSATHSFELMLSSFIFGLALGGLWIRKRVDSAANPGILLGYIQVAMGCAAVATIPLHNATFDLVAFVVTESPKTDTGYAIFNLVRYGVASLIMFPAAFCAGMTLPLATHILYARKDQGERAIGLVYSANTVGAITGLGFAVHFGLPVIGLNYLVASGALVDVLLGIALVAAFGDRLRTYWAAAALVLGTVGSVAAAMTFDPQKLASGAFRTGSANANGVVLEIAHGKTATISVEKNVEFLEIKTNGKPDASANLDPTRPYSPDEVTMRLSAVYPLMLHAGPARVANIGFGSGLTGATVLMDPRVRQLDTIEIEPKMVDLARHFGELNKSAYTDARSAIHIDDAKSFFASNGKTYDIIISEPSNPWVSGVAGLFSREFYHHVVRYLNTDGLFAQWIQMYEMNSERAVSVLKAMDETFDDYLVIALDWGDILLIGKAHGKVTMPDGAFALLSPELKATLRGIEVANRSDLTFRVLGNKAMFKPWLATRKAPANSDYHPYLDVNADHDRFLRNWWPDLYSLALAAYPISDILGGRPPLETPSALTYNGHFGPASPLLAAREVYEDLFGPMRGPDTVPLPANLPRNLALQGSEILDLCSDPPPGDLPVAVSRIAVRVLPHLSSAEGGQVLWALDQSKCLRELAGTQKEWRTLLTHIAARNPRGIGESSEQLLKSGMGITAIRTRYLLEMGMLGLVGAGEPSRAQALWETYSKGAFGDKPPDLISEILLAHARSAVPAP